jgi:hypothetical protein
MRSYFDLSRRRSARGRWRRLVVVTALLSAPVGSALVSSANAVPAGTVAFVTAVWLPDPGNTNLYAAVTCGGTSVNLHAPIETGEFDGGAGGCALSVSVPVGYVYTWANGDSCASATTLQTTESCAVVITPVNFSFYGFLQPINDPAVGPVSTRSVYKAGSTIPVKFQLKNADGSLLDDATAASLAANCGVTLSASYANAPTTSLIVDETMTAPTATGSNCFRYDSTAHQFVNNLATTKANSGQMLTLTANVDGFTHTLGGQYAIGIK